MKHEYSVQIVWSQEDEAYIAAVAELPGCLADGKTQEEALANLRIIAQEWVETAEEDSRNVPAPATAEEFEKYAAESQKQLQAQIQSAIQLAVQDVLRQIAASTCARSGNPYRWRGVLPQESEIEFTGGSRR